MDVATVQANGSKSAQSSFEDLFVELPHVGCIGLEGAITPVPPLKNGGGEVVGADGTRGKDDMGVGLIVGRDIL
jgi:hypothetical protein